MYFLEENKNIMTKEKLIILSTFDKKTVKKNFKK